MIDWSQVQVGLTSANLLLFLLLLTIKVASVMIRRKEKKRRAANLSYLRILRGIRHKLEYGFQIPKEGNP
jgi:hypothetical protein